MATEQQELAKRAKIFSSYVGAEIKGAITSRGYSQGDVADGIKRPRPTLNNWLNNKTPLSIEDAQTICEYIGVSIQSIVGRAYMRVEGELGPWPPIKINPSSLSEEGIQRRVNARIDAGGFGLAADHDPDKEASKGVDSEFA